MSDPLPKSRPCKLHVIIDDRLANAIDQEAQRLRLSRSDAVRLTLSERFERVAEPVPA